MRYLDLTWPTPAENLACDEALLEVAEAGDGGETLRFWEPRDYFVVLGYANRAAQEVDLEACRAHGVPVFRRCSGGGAVLQGPGCLNYNLVLKIADAAPLANVTSTNRFIMQRHAEALAKLLPPPTEGHSQKPFATWPPEAPPPPPFRHPLPLPGGEGRGEGAIRDSGAIELHGKGEASSLAPKQPAIRVQGHTDLTLGERKFSGNSQRRQQRCLVFHGTILLEFDFTMIEQFLRPPSRQPCYRQSRSHRDFLVNLRLPAEPVKSALQAVWDARQPLAGIPHSVVDRLVREKYSRTEWNFKYP
jgi:lipoate-protein ligase A